MLALFVAAQITNNLHRKGTSYVEVHLLVFAAISAVKFWTRDKQLNVVAQKLGCALANVSKR